MQPLRKAVFPRAPFWDDFGAHLAKEACVLHVAMVLLPLEELQSPELTTTLLMQ